jgi:hypothetical protein
MKVVVAKEMIVKNVTVVEMTTIAEEVEEMIVEMIKVNAEMAVVAETFNVEVAETKVVTKIKTDQDLEEIRTKINLEKEVKMVETKRSNPSKSSLVWTNSEL